MKYLDPVEKQKRDKARSKQYKGDEHSVQLTEVEAFFIMKGIFYTSLLVNKSAGSVPHKPLMKILCFVFTELIVSVNRKTKLEASEDYEKFLVFSLNLLELTATQKTFTLEATVRLGSVNMQHHRAGHNIISMIETPEVLNTGTEVTDEDNVNQYLFTVTYSNVSPFRIVMIKNEVFLYNERSLDVDVVDVVDVDR